MKKVLYVYRNKAKKTHRCRGPNWVNSGATILGLLMFYVVKSCFSPFPTIYLPMSITKSTGKDDRHSKMRNTDGENVLLGEP